MTKAASQVYLAMQVLDTFLKTQKCFAVRLAGCGTISMEMKAAVKQSHPKNKLNAKRSITAIGRHGISTSMDSKLRRPKGGACHPMGQNASVSSVEERGFLGNYQQGSNIWMSKEIFLTM